MEAKKRGELTIIMKAKDMCSYIMTVTHKSPKQYRFTFISKLQNLSLSAMENIYRANDVYLSGFDGAVKRQKRLDYQHDALTDLRILGYMAQLSLEQKCILPKQYEMITKHVSDCQNLLGAWITSDKKRAPKPRQAVNAGDIKE